MEENNNAQKIKLGILALLLLLLIGACSLLNGFRSFKNENSLAVETDQSNSPSELYYSNAEQHDSFNGAEEGEGDITYELIRALDEKGIYVYYFSLLNDKSTEIVVASGTPAGTYELLIRATASGDDEHKAGSKEFTIKITVNKAGGSFDELPTPIEGLVYTGSSMNLANPGTSSTGTIYYKVDDGEWDTSIPQAKDVGTYTVYYKLVGDGNHGDVGEQSFTVTISRASVGNKPSSLTVTYNGQKQSINYTDPAHVVKEGDASGTLPDVYKAIYTPENNYCWSDGTTSSVTVTLTIEPVKVNKPTQLNVVKQYTGSEQTNGYDKPEFVEMSGKDRGTAPDVYKAVYTPKTGCIWSDGATDQVIVTLTIESLPIDKPTDTDVEKVYNGEVQTNGYIKPDCVSMVGVDSGKDADTYKAIYTPKDNYCWSDGTKDPVTVTLTIKPAPVKKPTVLRTEKPYNGREQNNGYGNPDGVIVDGYYSGTDAGTYVAVYMPDSNHIWAGGGNDPVQVTLIISKVKVNVPTIVGPSSFRYDGKNHSVSLSHYNKNLIKASGDTDSKTDVGNYVITLELKDTKNSVWADGTTDAKTLNWSITSAKLNTPKVKTVFEYDPQDPVAYSVTEKDFDRNYNSDLMSIVSSDEGTLPGEYTVTVKLTDTKNYCWADGTTGNKTISWKINKAKNPITLPDQKVIYVNYNPNQQIKQFRAPENAVGAVTYTFKSARTKVTHNSVDYFDIVDENTNSIVIKPETPMGVYEVIITVHAAGNDVYEEFTANIKIDVAVNILHYVIKFDGNGADRGLVVDQNIYGTKIGDRLYYNQYVKDAYEFVGWNTEKDGSGEGSFSDEQYVTYLDLSPYEHDGVITLYAQWVPKTVKVFYNLNGGSFTAKDENEGKVVREYTVDSEPFELCHPVKAHYSFDGWSGTGLSKVTYDVTVDPSTAKTNRVFNANWSAKKTAVLLVKIPNDFEIPDSIDLTDLLYYMSLITYIDANDGPVYGETYGNILPAIGKEGYYGGWYTLLGKEVTAESTVSTYLDSQTFETVMSTIEPLVPEQYKSYISVIQTVLGSIDLDNTVILIGRETPYTNISYTVTHEIQNLNLDGYTELKTEKRFGSTDADINGEDIALTITGFTYASQDGDTKIKYDGSSKVVLKYDRDKYDVVFDSRGGSDIETQQVPYDGLVTEPENPKFGTKKFSGWYYNDKLFDFGTRIRGKITLYAKWDVKDLVSVIVKPLDPEKGGVSGTGTYEVGEEVVMTPYANEGYRFICWLDGNTDNPRKYTISEEDIEVGRLEFVAIFEEINSKSLVNYDYITYKAKPGDIIDVTDVFKSILLVERYSSEGSENLDFDIDRSVLVSRNKAYVTVAEDAVDGTYSIDVTVRPFLVDLRHRTSAIRIYVQVETEKHTVMFNSNGGTLVNTQYVSDGAKATVPEIPYREGYDFKAWYLDDEPFDFETEITEDITLEARWDIKGVVTCEITVSANDDSYGTVSGGGVYEKGDTAVLKAVAKQGYKFVCWNNDEQLTSSTLSFTVEEDADYVAYFAEYEDDYFKFNEKYYTLHTGQDYDTTNDVFVNLTKGSDYSVQYLGSNNSSLVEFVFKQEGRGNNKKYHGRIVVHDGAIPGETYSVKVVSNNNPDSYVVFNVEIYCTVKLNVSTVIDNVDMNWLVKLAVQAILQRFDSNKYVQYGSTVEKPSLSIIDDINEYGLNIDKNQLTWYLNGELYDFNSPVTSNITLKLGWRGKYNVTFDLGEGESFNQEVIKGDMAVEPAKPSREGYIFHYWMLNSEPYDFSQPVNSDLRLEACWTKGITVTFDYYNDESRVVYKVIDSGEKVAEPKDAVRSGYSFVGWYQKLESGEISDTEFDFDTEITEDITIVGKWTAKGYQVVYDTNGGTPVSTKNNVKWNDNDLAPSNDPHPILPIYAFAGWYINDDCTVPYRNQTYAEVANYNDDADYVILYAGWYNRSIVHYTDKFSSIAGEETEYIIRDENGQYLVFREYEILEASESGMFRMNKDNSGVIISSEAEPGTYYIKVSSVINTPIDYFVDIDILDNIQTIMIEWTVEPAPEIEETDDPEENADGTGENFDGVMFGMSVMSDDEDLDGDGDILNPVNENLDEEGEQPQIEVGTSADPMNNDGNNVDGTDNEGDNINSQSANDITEMIPPVVQDTVVVTEEDPSGGKKDEGTSSGEEEKVGGSDAGGDGGPEGGEENGPGAVEEGEPSGSDNE